jgi:hypothetical protein
MKFLFHFPKVSFAVIIICFLLPFITIKCGNYEIATLTGVDLVTGTHIDTDNDHGQAIGPNIFILISLVLAIAGLVLAFLKFRGNKMISLIISVLGLISLIVFYFNIRQKIPSELDSLILSMCSGYYIVLLGYLINSIFFGYQVGQKNETEQPDQNPTEPVQ